MTTILVDLVLRLAAINLEKDRGKALELIRSISELPEGVPALMKWASAHKDSDVASALVKEVADNDQNTLTKLVEWARQNPKHAIAMLAIGIGPTLLIGPVLGIVGFTAEGIAAGSIAAGIQSGIGNVAAGSTFAILQSAGAGGAGLAAVTGVVQSFSAAGVTLVSRYWRRGNRGDASGQGNSNDSGGDGNDSTCVVLQKEGRN